MKNWSVQEAKARFSEMLETCIARGPQMVTKRGTEAAVLVPADEWRRVTHSAQPTLKELLASDDARMDIPLPVRGRLRHRKPPRFG